jgi:hypothetical protein
MGKQEILEFLKELTKWACGLRKICDTKMGKE